MLPKMELTDAVLLAFETAEVTLEEAEGGVIIKRHASNHLGHIFCVFVEVNPQITSQILIKLLPAILGCPLSFLPLTDGLIFW